MTYKQSEPLLSINNITFSAVRFGETDQFMAVIATFIDGNKWMITNPQPKMTLGKVHREVSNLLEQAIYMAAKKIAPDYVGEALAYVRNLPEGHRSTYVTSIDKELFSEASRDIKNALVHALTQNDSFRAAVEFESRVPYLVGNRDLILLMDDILEDFKRKYNQETWIINACEAAEDSLRGENFFLDSQISSWKKAEGLANKQASG